MVNNQDLQQGDKNTRPGASTSPGKQGTPDTTANMQGDQTQDRERSIQTGQERQRTRGLARRPSPSPVFYGTGRNPFSMMRRMAEDMDRLFETFGLGRPGIALSPTLGAFETDSLGGDGTALGEVSWSPQVETFRRGDKLVMRADLPGLGKDDVKVEIDNDMLAISGERRAEQVEDRDGYYRSERSYGQFYRAIPIPDGVDTASCDASFKDGVLEVTLPAPKSAEKTPKRIPVR